MSEEKALLPSELVERAEQAHKAGRFAEVRALLKRLDQLADTTTAATSDPLSIEDRQRVSVLVARLRPDPMVAGLLVLCVILFVLVIARFWH